MRIIVCRCATTPHPREPAPPGSPRAAPSCPMAHRARPAIKGPPRLSCRASLDGVSLAAARMTAAARFEEAARPRAGVTVGGELGAEPDELARLGRSEAETFGAGLADIVDRLQGSAPEFDRSPARPDRGCRATAAVRRGAARRADGGIVTTILDEAIRGAATSASRRLVSIGRALVLWSRLHPRVRGRSSAIIVTSSRFEIGHGGVGAC
jgi:hypothetical protein